MFLPDPYTTRGYLPRDPRINIYQTVCFRLIDSVAGLVNRDYLSRLAQACGGAHTHTFKWFYENLLLAEMDLSHGSCVLRNPEYAAVVFNKLVSYDHDRYELLAWSIMPNHVHLFLYVLQDLQKSLRKIKYGTAIDINIMRHMKGVHVWQSGSYTRYIRTPRHFRVAVDYILNNPINAKCLAPFTGTREDIELFYNAFEEPFQYPFR